MVAVPAIAPPDGVTDASERELPQDEPLGRRLQRICLEEYDFVWRSLRRLGVGPPETDDAAQQVFIVLATKLASVTPGKERSFVFGIATRVAANWRRARAKRREVTDEDALGGQVVLPIAEERLDQASARAVLDAIVAGMPEDRRVVFVLFELEELTVPEIAALLDVPVNTVTSRLNRARDDLYAGIARLRARRQGV